MFIEVAGRRIEVTATRRNKRIRMRVIPPDGEVKVSCPMGTPVKVVEQFIISNINWVEKATQKVKTNSLPKAYVQGGNHFLLFGKAYEIIEEESNRFFLKIGSETCILGCPNTASREDKNTYLKGVMKTIAKKEFPPIVSYYEGIIGVKASGISYRFTTSRWGSCNYKTRHVNFSVYAIQKPKEYLEYLVCHELLHILYPNHGKQFKAHLKSIIPNAEKISRLK